MKRYITRLFLIATILSVTTSLTATPTSAGYDSTEACTIALSKLMTKQYNAATKCAQATEAGNYPFKDVCWQKYKSKCMAAFTKLRDKMTSAGCDRQHLIADEMANPVFGCNTPYSHPLPTSGAPNPIGAAWIAFDLY